MPTATIIVTEVRPPKPGGKKYVVVDQTNTFYYVWPDKAHAYIPGHAYDIQYSTQEFRGNTIRSIESGNQSSASPPPQPPVPAAPRVNGAPVAQSTGSGGYNTYRETSAADKLSMFVTAIVKAGVQSGQVQFNDEAISIAIQQAVSGYRNGWMAAKQQTQQPAPAPRPVPQPQPQHNDMNDDIPF